MEYLHSIQPHPVIHGDLKTENVLVGDDLIAKVRALIIVLFMACCIKIDGFALDGVSFIRGLKG